MEPRQSGRHTSLSYSELVNSVCIDWYVVTLKNSVPADWTIAAHQAARPPSWERRSGQASQLCSAPPSVNRIEPTKNVTPSAEAPTSCTYPGNGPIRKHADPRAKKSAIQRRRVITGAPC
jgi:hypothetical protein